jgi:hypothetical protein
MQPSFRLGLDLVASDHDRRPSSMREPPEQRMTLLVVPSGTKDPRLPRALARPGGGSGGGSPVLGSGLPDGHYVGQRPEPVRPLDDPHRVVRPRPTEMRQSSMRDPPARPCTRAGPRTSETPRSAVPWPLPSGALSRRIITFLACAAIEGTTQLLPGATLSAAFRLAGRRAGFSGAWTRRRAASRRCR